MRLPQSPFVTLGQFLDYAVIENLGSQTLKILGILY